jgi:hypothetical protein
MLSVIGDLDMARVRKAERVLLQVGPSLMSFFLPRH